MQEEIWKDIPNYEGKYQASDLGNVRSLNYMRTGLTKNLSQCKNKNGYYGLQLWFNSKAKFYEVHQLIAITFLNHVPNGLIMVVDHIDFNKENNNVSNLRIISSRENTSRSKSGFSSKYVGVSWRKTNNRWASSIKFKGKKIHLGYFKDEYDAHIAYQNKLKELTPTH